MIALDGTPTKSRLGANALLGVSMAVRARGGGRGATVRSTRTSASLDARWASRRARCPCR